VTSLLNPGQRSGIIDLAEVGKADVTQVGNKAALLGELLRADLPAVTGLVVCAQTSAGLRASREFSKQLIAELEEKLDTVLTDATAFAVRASVVQSSSGKVRALTQGQLALGQPSCEYYVPRDALPIAIIACASACLDMLEGQPGQQGAAVLIQPMVNTEIAGVAFSEGVRSGGPGGYLIEACWGLGRGLVDGNTDPDRYQIDSALKVIDRKRGRKQHKLDPNQAGTLVTVNESERLAWTLDTNQLARIGALAKRCEAALGGAQDIEFAVTGAGSKDQRIVLLQSNPVTAAKLETESVPPGNWVIYLPQLENCSEPLTPLSEDLLCSVLPGFARTIHGRVYLDFDKLNERLPVRASRTELTSALLYEQDLAKLPFSLGKLVRKLPLWLALSLWSLTFWLRSRDLSKQQRDKFWDFATKQDNNKNLNAKQLLTLFAKGRSMFSAPWQTPFLLHASSFRYLLAMGLLHRLVERWTKRELDAGTLQQLYTSNSDTLSNKMVADIAALGRSVAQSPELNAAFTAPLDNLGLHELLNTNAYPRFVSQFSEFVERFGHRGTRELELASSRWLEQPNSLLAMIGIQAKTNESADGYRLQLLARDDLHQALDKPWQRKTIDYLLRRIRYYLSLREDARHFSARALFLVRKRLLELEDRLLREQKLQHSGDLFFLRFTDIGYLDSGQLSPTDAATLILAAREQHAVRCSNTASWTLGYEHTRATAAAASHASSSHNTITGRCAAPGSNEGKARVILDPADLTQVEPGEVLILTDAESSMAAAIHTASAVVCERGDYMSNLATLAREWGVPFVVGATNCTRAIATGERVVVQATEGRVEILG